MTKYIILITILLTSVVNAEEIQVTKHYHAKHFYDRGNDCYVVKWGSGASISCVKREVKK